METYISVLFSAQQKAKDRPYPPKSGGHGGLILKLRDFYKDSDEYKKVYKQKSFDNWVLVINTLESWNILLTEVAEDFRNLYEIRNYSLHFNIEIENDVRSKSLAAVPTSTENYRKSVFRSGGNNLGFLFRMEKSILKKNGKIILS